MRFYLGLATLVAAYALLYPGISQPILSLTGTVAKADLIEVGKQVIVDAPETNALIDSVATAVLEQISVEGEVEAYHKTRSILGTVRDLYTDGFALVAFLVAFFSIGVPVIKGLMLLVSYLNISPGVTDLFRSGGSLLSKWSMADVYVVGVFVAFLAANAIRKEGGLLSFSAELGPGFYFFLGYCLLSILSSQLLDGVRRKNALAVHED